MILTIDDLKNRYKDYADFKNKIRREVDAGKLFRIRQGLYEDDSSVGGKYLASVIYSPSYLSFEFALSFYGLIPEGVYVYTSATFKKDRKKAYKSHFGTFLYRDVPSKAYPYGIKIIEERGYSYLIATPEKALCDKLYIMPPVTSVKKIKQMLFEDLRIDEGLFWNLSMDDLRFLSPLYGSKNLNQLLKMIKEQNR